VKKTEIVGDVPDDYPLQKKRHSFEFLRTIGHLRPRTKSLGAVFRVRHALQMAIHDFFDKRGFIQVHTPIITASDCEGAGQMFRVTTFDLDKSLPKNPDGRVDYTKDFFGKETSLTVSGQLEGRASRSPSRTSTPSARRFVLRIPTQRATWPSSGWWSRRWPFAI